MLRGICNRIKKFVIAESTALLTFALHVTSVLIIPLDYPILRGILKLQQRMRYIRFAFERDQCCIPLSTDHLQATL